MSWTEKQKEYLEHAVRRWNIKAGATRSGKTYLDYYVIPKRIRAVAGLDGLLVMLGNTKGTLQRNVIEPMQNIWGAGLVSNIRADNTSFMFGERVHCLGADNKKHVDRLRGLGAKYIYGDEIVTWDKDVFEMVKSRLDKPYSKFDGTCNPGSPLHWLKQFIDSGADVFYQNYGIRDNSFLDPGVREEMESEYTGVFYERYILGRWVQAEGLIYPMFSEKTHVTNEMPSSFEKYWVSVDYGTKNPCVFLLIGRTGNEYRVVDEYYYDGREKIPRTDDEHYTALEALVNGRLLERVIIDPSAASYITLIRRKGRYRVTEADNAVVDGIRQTASALSRGLIKFSDRCCKIIQEFGLYVWDETVPEDKPVKENDHALDALRYFVKTMNITADKDKRFSSVIY
jgi:PBSX family phage terminase large subunit